MAVARCRSSSARSSSVKNSLFAYLAGRCNGVSLSLVQMPCRSASPHGVVSAFEESPERSLNSAITAMMTTAPINARSRLLMVPPDDGRILLHLQNTDHFLQEKLVFIRLRNSNATAWLPFHRLSVPA